MPILVGEERCVFGLHVRLLSINAYVVRCHISVLSGRISMKLPADIRYVSANC